jgi:hypothetical protein
MQTREPRVQEEVFLPFPAPSRDRVLPVTRVRGTWIASVVRALKATPHFDAYVSELDPATRTAVMGAMAGDWLDIAVLMAHYEACDRLSLPGEEILQIAGASLRHAQGSVLAVTARAVANPWTLLGQLQRFWDRLFMGGGTAVFKLGPKEARVELVGFPGCSSRYCRIAIRGISQTAFEFISQRAFVTEVPRLASSTSMALRVAWV